jgi:uncharacterized membrane protein YhaH (DUF805 family)
VGAVGLIFATVFLHISSVLIGFGTRSDYTTVTTPANGPPTAGYGYHFTTSPWATFAVSLLLAFPWLSLAVKRRKDRGSSGLDVYVYFGLSELALFLTCLGASVLILEVVDFFFALYLLVVLGFLRGTIGPNRYGSDPLAGGTEAVG